MDSCAEIKSTLQWRNQIWQSLEEGAGKRCSECGVSVDSQLLEVTFADVLEAQLGSPGPPLSCRQFSVEKVLVDTAILPTLRVLFRIKQDFALVLCLALFGNAATLRAFHAECHL